MMLRNFKVCLILIVLMFSALPVFSEEKDSLKLSYGQDRWIALHLLLQAQLYSQNNYDELGGESESDATWSRSSQMRRSRIILNGQVNKYVEFFYQTDDIFVGQQGPGKQYSTTKTDNTGDTYNDSKGVYTQDAFINYKVADEFEVTVGLMCLPFMHHNLESAASLLGVDYNYATVPISGSTNEWRDTGLQFRGLIQRVFEYRVGVFRGYPKDDRDAEADSEAKTDGAPRFTGRIQVNFDEAETGFFYSGNYLGKKNILSIGGGIDYQKNAGNLGTYLAYTGDATIDYKISDEAVITFQGAYVKVAHQPGASVKNQWGWYAQIGALFYGQVQPVVKYQYWDGDAVFTDGNGDDVKISYMNYGLNYFIDGNNANIKAEYQNPMGKDNKSVSGEKKATIQFQIFI